MSIVPKISFTENSRESYVTAILLLLTAACVLVRAGDYLSGTGPVGNDSSSHIVAISTLADYIKSGQFHFWNPNFNLGFPLAHYYQPLPYVITAFTSIVIGGPDAAVTAYKLWVCILLALTPFCYYFAFSRLGLNRYTALLAALFSGTISSINDFGLSTAAYFHLGLYSVLFGAVFLPCAFTECIRYIRGDGRVSLAIVTLVGLYFSHSFMGTALIPLLILSSLVYGPRNEFYSRFFRLSILGVLFIVLTAFWTIPMLLTMKYMGGWPWVSTEHMHGVGMLEVLSRFFAGDFTDSGRFPIILCLSLGGIVFAQLNFRRQPLFRVITLGFLLMIFFLAGRTTFGAAVNWVYPPNFTLPMERYICMLDFFAILLAAIGGNWLIESMKSRFNLRWCLPLLLTVQIALPALVYWNARLEKGLRTRGDRTDESDFKAIVKALADEDDPGRYYTSKHLGLKNHWDMYLPAMYSKKPGGVSYGSGYHDSLNFFYLDNLRPKNQRYLRELLRLYNIRYLLANHDDPIPFLSSDIIANAGDYTLRRVTGDYGYFQLIGEPAAMKTGTPRSARRFIREWTNKKYPRGKPFLRTLLPIKAGFHIGGGDSALGVAEYASIELKGQDFVRPKDPGETSQELAENRKFTSTVTVDSQNTWLILKVTMHPFWNAFVDGEKVDIYGVSPAFMGIPVQPGEHEVVFEYRNPTFQKRLLILAIACLGAVVYTDLRRAQCDRVC